MNKAPDTAKKPQKRRISNPISRFKIFGKNNMSTIEYNIYIIDNTIIYLDVLLLLFFIEYIKL